jgi:hypothetical protein
MRKHFNLQNKQATAAKFARNLTCVCVTRVSLSTVRILTQTHTPSFTYIHRHTHVPPRTCTRTHIVLANTSRQLIVVRTERIHRQIFTLKKQSVQSASFHRRQSVQSPDEECCCRRDVCRGANIAIETLPRRWRPAHLARQFTC